MVLRLAIDDPHLEAALAPLASAAFSFPSLLVTDRIASEAAPEVHLLALSREHWQSLCQQATPHSFLVSQGLPAFHHVLIYDDPAFVRQRVERTLRRYWKLAHDDPEAFGVAPLLEPGFASRPFPHQIYDRRPIRTRAQKVRALEDLIAFVEALRPSLPSFSSHFVSTAIEVQEELLCNAIWDANPRLRSVPRDGDFYLTEAEAVLLEWGFDGQALAIAITDPFGAFPQEHLPRYLQALFETGLSQRREMRQHGPGAGLGLFMMLERATVLSLTVDPGRRTEVAAIMNLAQGPRGLMRGTHSLQYFRITPGAGHGTC